MKIKYIISRKLNNKTQIIKNNKKSLFKILFKKINNYKRLLIQILN